MLKIKVLLVAAALATAVTFAAIVPKLRNPVEVQNNLYANAVRQTVLVVTPDGQGSAFAVKRFNDKGLPRWFFFSAEHVVGDHPTVKIKSILRTEARIVGETVYTAKVLQAVPGLDIALLFVDAPSDAFLATEFADLTPAQQGDFVFTCGNFLGDDFPGSISVGIVAQVGIAPKPWTVLDQTTAPVYPGSSGGPIFNAAGQVLGIVVARVDATLGLFVPVRAIDEWATDNRYQWAVRGYSCPSDKVGKFLVAPEPPKPQPPVAAPPQDPPACPPPGC